MTPRRSRRGSRRALPLAAALLLFLQGALVAQDPPVTGIKTRIETADLPATVRFYTEILGLRVVEAWDEEGDAGVILGLGDTSSEAFLEFGASEDAPDASALSLQFRIDDMEAFLDRVRGQWPYRGPERRPWGSVYLHMQDPNGIQIIVFVGTV